MLCALSVRAPGAGLLLAPSASNKNFPFQKRRIPSFGIIESGGDIFPEGRTKLALLASQTLERKFHMGRGMGKRKHFWWTLMLRPVLVCTHTLQESLFVGS